METLSASKNLVQAYILNLSLPSSLDEMLFAITEEGGLNLDAILENKDFVWTAPRWASEGDIVFFTHAKMARTKLSALEKEYQEMAEFYDEEEQQLLRDAIDHCRDLYKKLNGQIFAYARVQSRPFVVEDDYSELLHWKSRLFVSISSIQVLSHPIPVDDCKDFLQISRASSITPLFGDSFSMLKGQIMAANPVPDYLMNSEAAPVLLRDVTPQNWISTCANYKHKFLYEAQFRYYYVNHFLAALGDQKKIYAECCCKKQSIHTSYIDNVILFGGKYLPVEVKLNVAAEKDLRGQVRKYCHDESIELDETHTIDPEKIYSNHVLVIDTMSLYLYDYEKDDFELIMNLNDLHTIDQIQDIRATLLTKL